MNFHPFFPITTDRLVLRPFTRGDLDGIYAYRSREDVARYLLDEALSRDECAAALQQRTTQTQLTETDSRITLAVDKTDGTLVGEVCLILRSDEARQGEIGWIFNPQFQGQGFATEACIKLLDLAFSGADLHRVFARCDAANAPSWRLMERLGMRREAHFREHAMFKGRWDDEFHYAILQREWLARNQDAQNR